MNNKPVISWLAAHWLVLLAALVPAVCSQTTDHEPVLHSNTRLIQVDVVAEDKKGHPLLDLTREDFEIYDQGKIQKVRIFTKGSVESSPVTSQTVDLKSGAGISFTNMAESRSSPGAVTIILIDSLNTKWVNQAYARQQIIKFLRQIEPTDHIAIYSMGFGGFRVLHDFTQDASELVRKLNTWNGDVNGQAVSQDSISGTDIGQELGDWLKGRSPEFIQSQQMSEADHFGTEQSLKILTAVARQLASIPGRKNLIWISEGFPLVDWSSLSDVVYGRAESTAKARERAEPTSFYLETMTAMREISDHNVAIYPVDALCLFNPFVNASAQDSTAVGFKALAGIHGREQAMDEIAKKTGGRAFYVSNDLKGAIRSAVDDAKATYTLGFYPDSAQLNGKFHSLKVKCIGRSDVKLRYRQGYIDSPETTADENERRTRIQNALSSPLDANGIGLSANINPQPGGADNAKHLLLKINSADLRFLDTGGVRVAEADIVIVQKDERGTILDTIQQTARVELNATRYEEVMRSGISFSSDLKIDRNTKSLRIVVGDLHTNRLGSISISRTALQTK